jgi:hypothetical protein
MPKVDTGIHHEHRITSSIFVDAASEERIVTYTRVAGGPPGSGFTVCDTISDYDQQTFHIGAGTALFSLKGTNSPSDPFLLRVSFTARNGYNGVADVDCLQLDVECNLPGYTLNVPTGATSTGTNSWRLNVPGGPYDVELAFDSVLYVDGITYTEEIEGAPTLTIGPIVATFTDHGGFSGLDNTYAASRTLSAHTKDSGTLPDPQPRVWHGLLFGGGTSDVPIWVYDVVLRPEQLVLIEEIAWEITETGGSGTPLLTGGTYTFAEALNLYADPADVTRDALGTVCTGHITPPCDESWSAERPSTYCHLRPDLAEIVKNGDSNHASNLSIREENAAATDPCVEFCATPDPFPILGRRWACLWLEDSFLGFYRNQSRTQSALLGIPVGPVPPPATDTDGLDLVRTTNGWLFRTWRSGTSIYVQRSRDGGPTWDTAVLIVTDADPEAAPALAVDRHDSVYLWFHADTLEAQGFVTENHGAWWFPYAGHAALRYPRPAWMADRFLLAGFNGDNLNVYQSKDGGITLDLAVTFAAQPKRRPALWVDRHDIAHIAYHNDAADLVHRFSPEPMRLGSWANLVTMVFSGVMPGAAPSLTGGIIAGWEGANLFVSLLANDHGTLSDNLPVPAGTLARAAPGVAFDRWDGAYLLFKDAGGAPVLFHAPHPGETWDPVP